MRVRFLTDPGRGETPRGRHYGAGEIHELTHDQAYKWVTVLGRAVEIPPEPAAHLLAETDSGAPGPASTVETPAEGGDAAAIVTPNSDADPA